MFRFGFVTMATGMFVSKILLTFPTGFDAWYSDLTLFALAVVVAMAALGFLAARFGQAGFSASMLTADKSHL